MPVNAITGLKRRIPRRDLPRKKRCSLGSTPYGRLLSSQAMEAFYIYLAASDLNLSFLALLAASHVNLEESQLHALLTFLVVSAQYFFDLAIEMLAVDSAVMDITDEEFDRAGYRKELAGIGLDHYENDDQCEENSRFTKGQNLSLCTTRYASY